MSHGRVVTDSSGKVWDGGSWRVSYGKDFNWTGGVALTRSISEEFLLGVEADWQGPDTSAGHGSTSLGLGAIYDFPGPLRLLASGGPTFEDGSGGFHAFGALGLDF